MRILVVDDEKSLRNLIKKWFEKKGHEILEAENAKSGKFILENESVDLVFLDLRLPDADGIDVLPWIKEQSPEVPVILITAFGSVESAVQAVKLGAYDFLQKPFDMDNLDMVAHRAMEKESLARRVGQFERSNLSSFDVNSIVHESPGTKQAMELARRAARSATAPVLITGETGAGKEVIARSVHFMSPAASNPPFSINCAAIPSTLLESEFFGYEKGAFTDAKASRKGLLEEAHKSTLILDEIGEMPLDLQSKLLRFLEDGQVRRLGSSKPRKVEVRIVAMTNRNMPEAIEKQEFRADLFYRLNVVPITVPPLRERREDIAPLFRRFIRESALSIGQKPPAISAETEEILINYPWPGNIREIKNLAERIILLEDYSDTLHPVNLPMGIQQSGGSTKACAPNFQGAVPTYAEAHDSLTRQLIREALKTAEGSITRASRILQIDRSTFRYHCRRLDISA